jgi:hypothetical protein
LRSFFGNLLGLFHCKPQASTRCVWSPLTTVSDCQETVADLAFAQGAERKAHGIMDTVYSFVKLIPAVGLLPTEGLLRL